MDLPTFLKQSNHPSHIDFADEFSAKWTIKRVKKGKQIARQTEPSSQEFILLDGCLTSTIGNQDGVEICVDMCIAPNVVSPNIARTRNGTSLVSIEATTDVLIAQMDTNALTEHMISSEPIRVWGNEILQRELARKADREWCLAALGGSERLLWFRERYPGYEEIFTHSRIASFLGVTPVTFSRLRTKEGKA